MRWRLGVALDGGRRRVVDAGGQIGRRHRRSLFHDLIELAKNVVSDIDRPCDDGDRKADKPYRERVFLASGIGSQGIAKKCDQAVYEINSEERGHTIASISCSACSATPP